MTNTFTRRNMILGASGVAVAGAAVAAQTATAQKPASTWDIETDIVCVGGGSAGLTAAVTAVDLGREVVILEKAPTIGGTTQKSGGVVWIPNNFSLRARGVKDERADCLKYLARFSCPQGYRADSPTLGLDDRSYKLLEAFYDTASPMIDHLRSLQAIELKDFVGFKGELLPDYADHLPENKTPRGRCLGPDQTNDEGGKNLITQLSAWLNGKKARILANHRVTAIVMEGRRAVGVEAHTGERTVRVRARQGVIFGSGGFAHNPELINLHQKFLYGACAKPTSTGDFITIAANVGAKMGDLQSAWRSQVVLEEALDNRVLPLGAVFLPGDSMFVVNKLGRRVVNEKRDYNDRTRVHFYYDPAREEYINQFLFMIFDERSLDAFGGALPFPEDRRSVRYLIQGESMSALAKALRERLKSLQSKIGPVTLDAGFDAALAQTLTQFNSYAAAGKDPDFLRGAQGYDQAWHRFFSPVRDGTKFPANSSPNVTMQPLAKQGPYFAIILAPGALDTNAGPLINEHAQILSTDNTPIEGLYGAGNCVSSPSREAYFGAGGTIGLAMTFAYRAAHHATGQS